jgi:hypothetical protein
MEGLFEAPPMEENFSENSDSDDQIDSVNRLKPYEEPPSPYRILIGRSMKQIVTSNKQITRSPSMKTTKRNQQKNPKEESSVRTNIISMVGKLMIIIQKAKKRLSFMNMLEINPRNFSLINDLTYYPEDISSGSRAIASRFGVGHRKLFKMETLRDFMISLPYTGNSR